MKAEGHQLKVLLLDAATGFYRMQRYRVGDFFGPVDLGIHLAYRHNGLNIGAGLLAGSVFPGSNRLMLSGISPCWHGFFVSSMGGAALVFDNLGINLLTVIGRAPHPSLLYLNRNHGEEIEVDGFGHPDLAQWIAAFDRDPAAAAYEFWYEMHKGIHESLREFPD